MVRAKACRGLNRCFGLHNLVDEQTQPLIVHGLGDMSGEAGIEAFLNVFVHSVAGEGNGRNVSASHRPELPDEIETRTIGKTQVAQDQIKSGAGSESGSYAGSSGDGMPCCLQEGREDERGVLMILHQ